jgi:hypothetical protein
MLQHLPSWQRDPLAMLYGQEEVRGLEDSHAELSLRTHKALSRRYCSATSQANLNKEEERKRARLIHADTSIRWSLPCLAAQRPCG